MEVPAIGNRFEKFLSTRNIQALLGFSGVGIIHGLMINLPLILLSHDDWRLRDENDWKPKWSPEVLALTYSSYFCGYLLSTRLTGWAFYNKFKVSPKWVILLAVLLNIVLTLFITIPYAIYYYLTVMIVRFNMGVAGGMALPALKIMLSKWMLPEERDYTRSLVHKSEVIGFAVFVFLTGTIAYGAYWDITVLIIAGLSFIWCILWIVFAQDTPQQQPFISVEERNKIVIALEKYDFNLDEPIPWSDVITSKPFLSILTVNVCSTWGLYMMLFYLPIFLTSDAHMIVTQIGLTLSLSLAGSFLISRGVDKCLTDIEEEQPITPLARRKIAIISATALPALLLLPVGFIHFLSGIKFALIVLTIMFAGSIFYGQSFDYHDIAPHFADQLTDYSHIILIKVRFLVPIVAGLVNNDIAMFILTAVLYVIACIAYLIYGSVSTQPWDKSYEEDDPCKGQFINEKNSEKVASNVIIA